MTNGKNSQGAVAIPAVAAATLFSSSLRKRKNDWATWRGDLDFFGAGALVAPSERTRRDIPDQQASAPYAGFR